MPRINIQLLMHGVWLLGFGRVSYLIYKYLCNKIARLEGKSVQCSTDAELQTKRLDGICVELQAQVHDFETRLHKIETTQKRIRLDFERFESDLESAKLRLENIRDANRELHRDILSVSERLYEMENRFQITWTTLDHERTRTHRRMLIQEGHGLLMHDSIRAISARLSLIDDYLLKSGTPHP